jgi:hypothetical protein
VSVEHTVTEGTQTILLSTTQATVPAGGTTTVTFHQPWANPRL